MKALLSTATGGPETLMLGELPEPVAGPGQVVVASRPVRSTFPTR
jgi:NADPH2:quinone reductase